MFRLRLGQHWRRHTMVDINYLPSEKPVSKGGRSNPLESKVEEFGNRLGFKGTSRVLWELIRAGERVTERSEMILLFYDNVDLTKAGSNDAFSKFKEVEKETSYKARLNPMMKQCFETHEATLAEEEFLETIRSHLGDDPHQVIQSIRRLQAESLKSQAEEQNLPVSRISKKAASRTLLTNRRNVLRMEMLLEACKRGSKSKRD
jgi:hypothetical protein